MRGCVPRLSKQDPALEVLLDVLPLVVYEPVALNQMLVVCEDDRVVASPDVVRQQMVSSLTPVFEPPPRSCTENHFVTKSEVLNESLSSRVKVDLVSDIVLPGRSI